MVTRLKEEVLRIIRDNQSITDMSAFQQTVAGLVFSPAHLEHQQEKMRAHWRSLEQLTQGHDHLSALLQQARALLEIPSSVASNTALLQFFADLFAEEALWSQWMQRIDSIVSNSSLENQEAIDQTALVGSTVRKRIVIVGGGPLSVLLAGVLAPYLKVTIVTMERRLADQWRTRPMWLNSTCAIRSYDGAPLPLLSGPTTRALPRPFLGLRLGLDVDVLSRRDALTVACEVGEVIYPWGPHFGELLAHNFLMHAEDIVTHQWVDISQLARNDDGTLRLVMYDVDTRRERLMDAFAVFLITGPGPESSKIASSRQVYNEAGAQVDRLLEQARTRLVRERELLRKSPQHESDPELQRWEKARSRVEAVRVARTLQTNLPPLLSLTTLQKVNALWYELEEFGVGPKDFPLARLFNEENSVGYAGSANTMQTLKEYVDGSVVPAAYPGKIRPKGPRKSTIYNERATSAEAYRLVARRRYWDVFTPTTRTIPFKVARYRVVYDANKGRNVVEVTHFDANGKRRRRRFDYLFDATGLDRSALEDNLPSAFRMRTVCDSQGIAVARGDETRTLFVVGSATGMKAPAFSTEIQRILDALGISDNTVALWARGVEAERLAYTFLLWQRPAGCER